MAASTDKIAPVPRVAVIGLGVTGIAAVKNLREAGLQVQGFEQNDHIGGLWQWASNPNLTTVLKSTRANIGKQRNCYPDFPFSDDVPTYPTATDIVAYLDEYVKHFELKEYFRMGLKAERLERSKDGTKWTLKLNDRSAGSFSEDFDKVVIATGPFNRPFIPEVAGSDEFKGQIMHAQAYKDPDDFAGKKVVVVGLSNTGGDTAVDLVTTASQVYLSHRSGARVISRPQDNEPPLEARITRRMVNLGLLMNQNLPWLSNKLSALAIERNMRKSNPHYQASWNLLPAPPVSNAPPVMNDFLLSRFADGSIVSKPGVKRFWSPSSVEFADGSIVKEVGAVIFATGYQADYSMLAPEADPTAFDTTVWDHSLHSNGLKYPRLYQGMFSTRYPHSLAFIGPFRGHSLAIFNNADLSTTAVAQVFAGHFPLPSQPEIEAWCDQNYAHNCRRIAKWRISKPECFPRELERWMNAAAGNEVNERLGWGWQGWSFWWKDHRLYRMLMDGVDTSHTYRLWEGRGGEGARKRWEGARAAIEKANNK